MAFLATFTHRPSSVTTQGTLEVRTPRVLWEHVQDSVLRAETGLNDVTREGLTYFVQLYLVLRRVQAQGHL